MSGGGGPSRDMMLGLSRKDWPFLVIAQTYMSSFIVSQRREVSKAADWRNRRSYSRQCCGGWLANSMISSVWYFTISRAVSGKYERWQQRYRFQASSQEGRSVITRLDSFRLGFGLVSGWNSGGVCVGNSNLLRSTYSPLRIILRIRAGTGGAQETDEDKGLLGQWYLR